MSSHSESGASSNGEQQYRAVPLDGLQIKLRAFENDFKLSLEGAAAHITSLRDEVDVATGYERVQWILGKSPREVGFFFGLF